MYFNFTVLRSLSKKYKLLILSCVDVSTAFISWIIFGPPFSVIIATNFEVSLSDTIHQNYLNFLIPTLLTLSYFFYSGFYRSSIRFSDSRDLISRAIYGSIVFGFSWGIVYALEYEIIRNQYLLSTILKSILMSYVFYAFLQVSRDTARILLNSNQSTRVGKPVLIYGAGAAGNELYHSIKHNSEINIIGFFDKSMSLKGAEINSIKIYGNDKHLKKLTSQYPDLEVYLAIPSLGLSERRKIISSLEGYKVAVRTMPALHELVADEKKNG